MTIPARLLKGPEEYAIWEITRHRFDKQFMIILSATLPDLSNKKIGALIDTGTEAKLLRTDLLPDKFLKPAKRSDY